MTTGIKRAITFHNRNTNYTEKIEEWGLTSKSTIIINEHGHGITVNGNRDGLKNGVQHGGGIKLLKKYKCDEKQILLEDDDGDDVFHVNGDKIVNGNHCLDEVDSSLALKSAKTEIFNEHGKRRKLQTPLVPQITGKARKLVIHFDIRNTVLVADSVTNVSVEQALNSFLTGVSWGRQCSTGDWVWHTNTPSLTPPNSDTITYYKHLEKQLVRTPSVRAKLRQATGEFTEEDGKQFQSYFKKHLKLLQWKHPKTPGYEKLTMKGKDGTPYHYILPSVYRMIHWLKQNKRDFAIIFRTYGLDANNVLASLAYGLNGHHPGYPKLPIRVNHHPGKIKRSSGENPIVFETFHEITGDMTRRVSGDREGYELMSEATGISAFVDDFHAWQGNHYHHSSGKPFYIDLHDKNTQHIFFDDNFRSFEDDSIIDVRVFETKGVDKTRSLSKNQVAKYQKTCLVQANLLESIENENYFTDAVQLCERNYTRLLAEMSSTVKKRKLSV